MVYLPVCIGPCRIIPADETVLTDCRQPDCIRRPACYIAFCASLIAERCEQSNVRHSGSPNIGGMLRFQSLALHERSMLKISVESIHNVFDVVISPTDASQYGEFSQIKLGMLNKPWM